MSTRAMIYIKYYEPGMPQFKAAYCHYDGYLKHVGRILQKYYDTTEKVEKIIEAGEIEAFNNDGSFVEYNDSDMYFVFNYESEFLNYIDNHYIWNSVENRWYHSDWDEHNWNPLSSLVDGLEEKMTLKEKILHLPSIKIQNESYLKLEDVITLVDEF